MYGIKYLSTRQVPMNKYIIGTGCSFTESSSTWLNRIPEYRKDLIIYNHAFSGAPPDLMANSVIWRVLDLEKKGINLNDVYVLIQASHTDRFSIFINKSAKPFESGYDYKALREHSNNQWKHLYEKVSWGHDYWTEWEYRKMHIDPATPFYNENILDTCGFLRGHNDSLESHRIFDYYWNNIVTLENLYINYLNEYLKLQWFLKSKDIKYKIFCGWNTFVDGHIENISSSNKLFSNNGEYNILKKKKNKNSPFFVDDMKMAKIFWDMIDWSQWWKFENKHVKFGGLREWTQYNLSDNNDWYCQDLNEEIEENGFDSHPSEKSHDEFCKNVVLDWIKDF